MARLLKKGERILFRLCAKIAHWTSLWRSW